MNRVIVVSAFMILSVHSMSGTVARSDSRDQCSGVIEAGDHHGRLPANLSSAQLIEHLASRDPAIRRDAARQLGDLGADASPAVPSLARLLSDEEERVRGGAVRALIDIGPASELATPQLVQALSDSSGYVRYHATVALGDIGYAVSMGQVSDHAHLIVPALTEALDDETIRRGAVQALRLCRQPAVAILVECLAFESESLQEEVIRALGWIGPASAPAVPHLHSIMRESGRQALRRAVSTALGDIGLASSDAILELMSSPEVELRREATVALKGLGLESRVLVPQLVSIIEAPDIPGKFSAVQQLGNVGGTGAIEALTGMLGRDDLDIVRAALGSLARIGPGAHPAMPAIMSLATHADSLTRCAASRAWLAIDAESGSRQTIEILRNGNESERQQAASGLRSTKGQHSTVVPALVTALEDKSLLVRRAALWSAGLSAALV